MTPTTASPSSPRRDFLKQSSAALAGTALAGSLTNAHAFSGGEDEIKIGLVGCGGRGRGAVSQALSTSGKVKLVALADAFEDKVESVAKHFSQGKFASKTDVPQENRHAGFDAYKKVIDSCDLVVLATTPGFRPVHFEYAIQQGKHVFMEKPVASDPRGCRRVLAAAEEANRKGLKVGVGLQRHHAENYKETIKRLQDGALGEIVSLRAYWDGRTPWTRARRPGQTEMEYQMMNWYYFNWLCGDHIVEQHIHNLDVCNWLMGDYPSLAQGKGGREVRKGKDHGQTFDHHNVEFVYGSRWFAGVRMHSSCRHIPGCWNQVAEFADCANGYANIGASKFYDRSGKVIWEYEGQRPNPYQAEHDALFRAVRDDTEFNEAFNGAKSTMTAIYGRMCTYSGRQLSWGAALNSKVDVFPHDDDFKWGWDANPPVLPDENGNYPVPVPGVTKVV